MQEPVGRRTGHKHLETRTKALQSSRCSICARHVHGQIRTLTPPMGIQSVRATTIRLAAATVNTQVRREAAPVGPPTKLSGRALPRKRERLSGDASPTGVRQASLARPAASTRRAAADRPARRRHPRVWRGGLDRRRERSGGAAAPTRPSTPRRPSLHRGPDETTTPRVARPSLASASGETRAALAHATRASVAHLPRSATP